MKWGLTPTWAVTLTTAEVIKMKKRDERLIADIAAIKTAIDKLCADGYQHELVFENNHDGYDWEDLQWFVEVALEVSQY